MIIGQINAVASAQGVCTKTPYKCVVVSASVKRVVTSATYKRVTACTPKNGVTAITAIKNVPFLTAGNGVIPIATKNILNSKNDVRALASACIVTVIKIALPAELPKRNGEIGGCIACIQQIYSDATKDGVIACTTNNGVVTATSNNAVIAQSAINIVACASPNKGVVLVSTN